MPQSIFSYQYVPQLSVTVDKILGIYHYLLAPHYQFKNDVHDSWELVVCYEGESALSVENKKYFLKKHQVFLHRPMEKHDIVIMNKSTTVGIVVFQSPSEDLYRIADMVIDCHDYVGIYSAILCEGVSVNASKYNINLFPEYAAQQATKILIEYFLILILRKFIPKTVPIAKTNYVSPHGSPHLVADIIAFMQEHVQRPLMLQTLSEQFGYSKEYICKLFKKAIGISPIEYFNNMRIEKAKELFSLNFYDVSDVYKQLNYSSLQYFSGQFKKATGVSPAEYAKHFRHLNFQWAT